MKASGLAVDYWFQVSQYPGFNSVVAQKVLRADLNKMSIVHLFKSGAANRIRY
jgi:hypothetical protein